jgi:serine/threonine protein kinase
MANESDLMFILIALQMEFISQEQLFEARAAWAQDRKKPVSKILIEKGFLNDQEKAAIEGLLAAHMKQVGGGDPEKTLAAFDVNESVRRSLLLMPFDADVKNTLAMLQLPKGIHKTETVAAAAGEERYSRGPELGRGGLGRVIAGEDSVLKRSVAIKEMLAGTDDPSLIRRFMREGEIAGRLTHPNVVPVYDIGVREESGSKNPYFVMTRIVGHDLRKIIQAVEMDENDSRHKFSRPRLLKVFQDVCLAMAYAHDHGIIHRDLKPSNIMVGKYGEVYVVDWGLAKVLAEKEDVAIRSLEEMRNEELGIYPERAHRNEGLSGIIPHSEMPALTMEGEVLGTPAYMPPEQADGKISELDERSDIYSLGAILYEILTFRPPFGGKTAQEVLEKVISTHLTHPAVRASEVRRKIKDEETVFPESVPKALEEIVLKAMSKKKDARYQNVMEIHEEVQSFIEGEKQREWNHIKAEELTVEGKKLADSVTALRDEVRKLRKEVKEKGKEVKHHWPIEKKADFWALQKKAKKTRNRIVETFGESVAKFHEALGFEKDHKGAKAGLADLYWEQYEIEEEKGDRTQMAYFENLVRQHNEGQYDARLKGDGTLSISTRHFPCKCMVQGRMVKPDEMDVMGYHPFSGRALDGHKSADGMPHLEPKEPLKLKMHGADCKTEALGGAHVRLFRYEEKNKIMVPAFPEGVECHSPSLPPDAVLRKCFDSDSPYKPKEGLYLGKTPIEKFKIPIGSYLLIIHKDGFNPVRVPVHIERLGEQEINVALYRHEEIPTGFIQVPGGKFIYQGDKDSDPKEIKDVQDFFIAKYPVTCREYLGFLNDITEKNPKEAAKRVPRESEKSGYYWPKYRRSRKLVPGGYKEKNGKYVIPTKQWLDSAPEEMKKQARRLSHSPIDWAEDWPVLGVSWEDMVAYTVWKTEKTGYIGRTNISIRERF